MADLNVRVRVLLVFVAGMVVCSNSALAEQRDIRANSVGIAVGREEKTANPDFEGTKIILDIRYTLDQESGDVSDKRKCCTLPSRPEYYYWNIDTGLRWDPDDGLEYVRPGVTPWAVVLQPDIPSEKKLRTTHDLLEVGIVRYLKDEPLEVEKYLELTAARAGRAGTFKWSPQSQFSINMMAQASIGWSWAESENPAYRTVSNPFAGIHYDIEFRHEKFGALYATGRFVNGFSFSSPQRGHPTVREARARFGYAVDIYRCMDLDIFLEKRSFYFDEANLPGLYTKSGTVAGQINCRFR